MNTAAIVLAAGASQRLGEPKQLIQLGSETMLERAVRTCREAGCTPIVIVLGASAELIRKRCKLEDTVVVLNDEWAEGMGSSVRTGVNALDNSVDGCIIVTCDMPAVAPSHLRELMHQGEITASRYAGRRGVPAYFPATAFDALTQLHGDAGARELLKNANAVQLPNGELDIDTAEDLLRAREIFG